MLSWALLFLIIALVVMVGWWWLFARPRAVSSNPEADGPCGHLHERWRFYQRLCDDERAAVDGWDEKRRAKLGELRERLSSLEDWQGAEREQPELESHDEGVQPHQDHDEAGGDLQGVG